MEKHLLCVSYHSSVPQNTGSNIRIRNLLLNLKELKPVLLAPAPIDGDLPQRPFLPYEAPPWVRRRLRFNPAILGCYGNAVYRRSRTALSGLAVAVVQSEHLWSFPLARRIARLLGVPLVLVEHNIETIYLRRAYRAPLLPAVVAAYERWALQECDRVVVCSEADSVALTRRFGTPLEKIWVVPNGIHVQEMTKPPTPDAIPEPLRDRPLVLFLGKTNYPPNAEAIRIIRNELVPRVQAQQSNTLFVIVGGPHQADYSQVEDGIAFTGFVEDLHALLHLATVSIAPLTSGSGTRLKILEYAAHAQPIVATTVAVEGLGFIDKKEVLIADDWDKFAGFILSIVRGHCDGKVLGQAAYRRVIDEYQWQSIATRYGQLLLQLIGSPGGQDGSH